MTDVPKDEWTKARLIDEFYLELDSKKFVDELDGMSKRHYEQHARDLLYRIPIYRPAPTFTIHLQHISERVRQELSTLEDQELDNVIREVISRIFEGIDDRYFRLSVRHLLEWEIKE